MGIVCLAEASQSISSPATADRNKHSSAYADRGLSHSAEVGRAIFPPADAFKELWCMRNMGRRARLGSDGRHVIDHERVRIPSRPFFSTLNHFGNSLVPSADYRNARIFAERFRQRGTCFPFFESNAHYRCRTLSAHVGISCLVNILLPSSSSLISSFLSHSHFPS